MCKPGDIITGLKKVGSGKEGRHRASLTLSFHRLEKFDRIQRGCERDRVREERKIESFWKTETCFISLANSLLAFLLTFTMENQRKAGEVGSLMHFFLENSACSCL